MWGLGLKYLAAVFVWEIRQELKIRLQYSLPVTRNFDNRMGKDAQVYLGSAELASDMCIARLYSFKRRIPKIL